MTEEFPHAETGQPASLRELTEEEVVAAARAFWLDELCERVDEDEDTELLWET